MMVRFHLLLPLNVNILFHLPKQVLPGHWLIQSNPPKVDSLQDLLLFHISGEYSFPDV